MTLKVKPPEGSENTASSITWFNIHQNLTRIATQDGEFIRMEPSELTLGTSIGQYGDSF